MSVLYVSKLLKAGRKKVNSVLFVPTLSEVWNCVDQMAQATGGGVN